MEEKVRMEREKERRWLEREIQVRRKIDKKLKERKGRKEKKEIVKKRMLKKSQIKKENGRIEMMNEIENIEMKEIDIEIDIVERFEVKKIKRRLLEGWMKVEDEEERNLKMLRKRLK